MIAGWTAQTGEVTLALSFFEALLPDLLRELNSDHPLTRMTTGRDCPSAAALAHRPRNRRSPFTRPQCPLPLWFRQALQALPRTTRVNDRRAGGVVCPAVPLRAAGGGLRGRLRWPTSLRSLLWSDFSPTSGAWVGVRVGLRVRPTGWVVGRVRGGWRRCPRAMRLMPRRRLQVPTAYPRSPTRLSPGYSRPLPDRRVVLPVPRLGQKVPGFGLFRCRGSVVGIGDLGLFVSRVAQKDPNTGAF